MLREPLTGSELVERLHMGTTGQLCHHIKALLGADLLMQEERGGKYAVPAHRVLPMLLLLAAVSDLLDAGDYMEVAEARNDAGAYPGASPDGYDPHHLLWAVVENSVLEHQAGFCSEVNLFLHGDGSVTVPDNGSGIPVQPLPETGETRVHAVLTELGHYSQAQAFMAPGGVKGVSIAVVNALSQRLTVEVRREGKVFRQDYRHGIPQPGLLTVGTTRETGTSVTYLPDREIFRKAFDRETIASRVPDICEAYPGLSVQFTAE